MKAVRKILPLLFSIFFMNQSYPHVMSDVNFRVTNRRFISHILFEMRNDSPHITLLTSHPVPWNFYEKPHPLYYRCKTICLEEMKKLNQFLDSGYNIGLKLSGSDITEIIYYDP